MPKTKQKEINNLREIMRKKIEEICESSEDSDQPEKPQNIPQKVANVVNRQVTNIGYLSKYT
jgi:hypothetical protein